MSLKNLSIVLSCLLIIVSSFLFFVLVKHGDIFKCPIVYKYIRQDIGCESDITIRTNDLKEETGELIDKLIKNKSADKISVFYRNLDNGQWFGINENENFNPGSLLKLPLAIAYFKLAEVDPGILKQEFQYTAKDDSSLYDAQVIKPEVQVKKDGIYTTDELIERMIKYSDNEVLPILSGFLNKTFLEKVYVDMGIYIPTSDQMEKDFVSVKTYAGMLRILYNSSYLNQYYSDKLLSIMSTSSFAKGIKAGVPSGVVVANKFGERILADGQTGTIITSQLHDCGIVYKYGSPYVLCVMTSGGDESSLMEVISKISNKIYNSN